MRIGVKQSSSHWRWIVVPYETRRWLFVYRTTGLNNEPIRAQWGLRRLSVEARWMERYYEWLNWKRA